MATSGDFLIIDMPGTGLQRLRAGFSGHAYDRHRHETYAIGFTEAGLQCFHYRGAARASTPGRVIVIHPDEAHDGHAGATGGFAYRMLYADPALIAEALGCPFVSEPVIDDPALRRVIADAFADFPDPIEDLAIPSIVAALADALSRRAGSPAKTARFDNHNALDVARQLLLEGVSDHHIGAAALEAKTGVDRFTLARGFRMRFGTSPHRYLTGRRLERVTAEIVPGTPLAEAAAAAGFADQSHMTRHFKSRFGLTPGRYAALLRPGVKP